MTRARTTPSASPSPAAASPAAASPAADAVGAVARGQLDAALKQSLSGLQRLEELQRLQLETTHLAVQRVAEMQRRLQGSDGGAGLLELQGELVRFEAAAAVRFWQQLFDIGLRDVASRTEQLAGALDQIPSGLKAPDFGLLLGMIHTGIGPIDDMFGAALSRELVPPPAR